MIEVTTNLKKNLYSRQNIYLSGVDVSLVLYQIRKTQNNFSITFLNVTLLDITLSIYISINYQLVNNTLRLTYVPQNALNKFYS